MKLECRPLLPHLCICAEIYFRQQLHRFGSLCILVYFTIKFGKSLWITPPHQTRHAKQIIYMPRYGVGVTENNAK